MRGRDGGGVLGYIDVAEGLRQTTIGHTFITMTPFSLPSNPPPSMSLAAPLTVLYCDKCGNPPEFCSFGPDFKTHCKPWLIKNHPNMAESLGYANAAAAAAPADAAPAAPGDSKPSATPTAPWTPSQRLTKFYEKYVPSKLADIPKLLTKYEGKEEALFGALTKKYGDEPLDPYLAAKWGITEEDDNGGSDSDEDAVDNHTAADEASRQLSGMRLAQAKAAAKVGAIGEEGEEEEEEEEGKGGKKVKVRGAREESD